MVFSLQNLKAVITAGGVGTRLLPFSKEIPKEMAPILMTSSRNNVVVKPIVQAIFEQLFSCGARDFVMVVGRGKRAIEDHFTPDPEFLQQLVDAGKTTGGLASFYHKLTSSNISFINQPRPLGFGDAVQRTQRYVSDPFLVHAGDTYIISENNLHLQRLTEMGLKYSADVAILLEEVKDPRPYGVVIGSDLEDGVIEISKAVEKPKTYVSNMAIMPVYIFGSSIFEALANVHPADGKELNLTDAMQILISEGKKVIGVNLKSSDIRLDIGSAETLMDTLRVSSERLATVTAGNDDVEHKQVNEAKH
jgi:UTP--glucose-1-phosphate uridylyltransferase